MVECPLVGGLAVLRRSTDSAVEEIAGRVLGGSRKVKAENSTANKLAVAPGGSRKVKAENSTANKLAVAPGAKPATFYSLGEVECPSFSPCCLRIACACGILRESAITGRKKFDA